MDRPLIIIDDKIPYIQGFAEKLGRCIYLPAKDITCDSVKEADMLIIRTRTICNASLLSGSKVKYVVTATIGFDHIDTEFMEKQGIAWKNCPGCNAGGVAQYVYGALNRAEGAKILPNRGYKVGIIGVGNVGTKVADVLRYKGYEVLCYDPPRKEKGDKGLCELSEIVETCEAICVHTPLTTSGKWATKYMIDADFFDQLKVKRPLLLNAGRGGVVCEKDLIVALEEGKIRAAVIDTWENEPNINRNLLQKAFIATPHIAGYSADGKANATRMALGAAAKFLNKDVNFEISPLPLDYESYNPYNKFSDEAQRRYDPFVDSIALKRFPTLFENFRGNYPIRREEEMKM